jgi:hypothetical protein
LKNKLTVVDAKNDVAKASLPPFKAYCEFQDTLDLLKRKTNEIARYVRQFEKHPAGRFTKDDDFLSWAEDALAIFDKSGAKHIAEAEAALSMFDIEGLYDKNGDLKKSWIAAKVSELVGSFPQANVANPEIYIPMLINEIMADGVSDVVVLEMTVRALRQTSKFIPSISEVLAAKKKVTDEWSERYDAIEDLPWQASELRRLIEEAKPVRLQEDERLAAAQLQRDEQQRVWKLKEERRSAMEAERRLPLKVGDRATTININSPCTVVQIDRAGEGDFLIDMCWVECDIPIPCVGDDDDTITIEPLSNFRKLISGDKGFEREATSEQQVAK